MKDKRLKTNKKVRLPLIGLSTDSFYLVGICKRSARKNNWTEEEIDAVVSEAMDGDSWGSMQHKFLKYCIKQNLDIGSYDYDEIMP